MPSRLVEYQLRIRNAANSADALVVTSIRGGTNPYIAEDGIPSGDGASFDPITGVVTSGSFTMRVVDPITGGTSRLFTSQLEDANGRQQLGHRRAFIEFREDGGAWQTLYAGRLSRYALASDAVWDVVVSDFMEAEHGHKAFDQKSDPSEDDGLEPFLDYLARWPNRGCILGGPILGGFLHIPDLGGWQFKIGAQGSVPGFPGYAWTRFDFVSGYDAFGEPVDKGARLDEVRNAINAAAEAYWEPDYEGSPFGSFPDLRVLLVNGASYDVYTPAHYVGDPTALRSPRQLLAIGGPAPAISRCSFWLAGTIGTVGNVKRVHILTRPVSDISPVYWTGHPADLIAKLQGSAESNLPFSTSAIETVRDAIGRSARLSIEVNAPQNVGAFLEQTVYGPWGVGTRANAAGEIEAFNGRIFVTNTLPSITITGDDVERGATEAFELDASGAIRTVHVEHTRLVQPMLRNSFGTAYPDPQFKSAVKPLVQQAERFERTNADPGAIGTGEVTYSIPGMVHFSVLTAIRDRMNVRRWADGRAAEIFDRNGRGPIAVKTTVLRTSAAMSAKLGDEVLVDLPQLPNANKRLVDDVAVSARAMQIVHLTPTLIGHQLTLVDSGPNASPFATVPTHTIAKSTGAPRSIAELTITNAATLNTASAAVRVQIAITSGAAPNAADYTDVLYYVAGQVPTTAQLLPPVSADSTVYARARAEKIGVRPSNWSTAVSVALDVFDPPTTLTATPSGSDGSQCDLTWTIGEADALTEVWLRLSAESFAAAILKEVLPAGSTFYRLEGLTPGVGYTASVRHIDPNTGDRSTLEEETFTAGATTVTLPVPLLPHAAVGERAGSPTDRVFGSRDRLTSGWYGMVVAASVFPSDVEFEEAVETAVGAGTYGSYATVGRVASVMGDWTFWSRIAPSDRLKRKLRARHVRDGATSSGYTAEVIADPNVSSPIPTFLKFVDPATKTVSSSLVARVAQSGRFTGTLTTTPVALTSITIPTDQVALLEARAIGRASSGGTALDHRVLHRTVENVAGTLTLGIETVVSSSPSITAYQFNLVISGTAVELRINKISGSAAVDFVGSIEPLLVGA